MLTDNQMTQLAEMCRWADYPGDGMAYTTFEQDHWQLTLAGYFVVIERLELLCSPMIDGRWTVDHEDCGATGDTLTLAIDAALQEIIPCSPPATIDPAC